jgi:signal transduction histidine kinase
VAAIQATLQVTLRKDRTKEELIASMEDLGSAVDLLSSLTQKLISSTRISYQSLPQNEPIDLQSFIADQIKIFHSRAEQRQIKIQTEPSPFTRVLASKPLLSEILGNLIENAILYSHSEGCVSISWTQNAANAVIQIRDNGPGFPERVKASLFEPFVRGDERKTIGSGLGLSIAGKSAQLLNGSVSLQESGPSGSALRVTLPLA